MDSAFTNRAVAEKRKDDKTQYATREDVEKAVEQLSPEDERRLQKFALYRIRGLGRKAVGWSHEDLQREAITATWIGAEDPDEGGRWRKRTSASCSISSARCAAFPRT